MVFGPSRTGSRTGYAQIKVNAGQSVGLVAAKLELGSQQTLARQNEDGEWEIIDPPDYALQYALCSLYSPSTGEWVGNQHSNPNLLDNWYFADAVNQRGQTEYTSDGYAIDRWRLGRAEGVSGARAAVSSDGIKILPGNYIRQMQEDPRFEDVELTFSALINDDLFSFTFVWKNSTVYLASPVNKGWILAYSGVSKYVHLYNHSGEADDVVKAAKLELGPIQTLAHQDADGNWVLNDPPPNKALELAKCQYYYKPKNDNWISACVMGNGYVQIRIPGKMRIVPAVENTIPIFGTDEQWHNSVPLISKFLFPDSVVLNYFDSALIGSAFNRGDCVLLSYQPALNADL